MLTQILSPDELQNMDKQALRVLIKEYGGDPHPAWKEDRLRRVLTELSLHNHTAQLEKEYLEGVKAEEEQKPKPVDDKPLTLDERRAQVLAMLRADIRQGLRVDFDGHCVILRYNHGEDCVRIDDRDEVINRAVNYLFRR